MRPDAVGAAAAAGAQLRRAVRRFVGDPRLPRLGARTAAREGRALGRGRRRGARRLRDVPRAPGRGALCAAAAGRSASRLVPAMVRRLPVSHAKVSFDYKAKRFVTGAYLPPAAGHLWWKTILDDDDESRAVRGRGGARRAPRRCGSSRSLFAESDGDELDRLQYIDAKLYLPADILVKVDRMSMAHSLEARVPFLDRAMVELAGGIPSRLRLRGMTTKYLLRRAMADRLPAERRQRQEARLQRADAVVAGGRPARFHARHAVAAASPPPGTLQARGSRAPRRRASRAPARSQPSNLDPARAIGLAGRDAARCAARPRNGWLRRRSE